MDRRVLRTNCELWPVVGYFTTVTLVKLSCQFHAFFCAWYFLLDFQKDQVYRMGPLIDAESDPT